MNEQSLSEEHRALSREEGEVELYVGGDSLGEASNPMAKPTLKNKIIHIFLLPVYNTDN